jgi:hypothetical protein
MLTTEFVPGGFPFGNEASAAMHAASEPFISSILMKIESLAGQLSRQQPQLDTTLDTTMPAPSTGPQVSDTPTTTSLLSGSAASSAIQESHDAGLSTSSSPTPSPAIHAGTSTIATGKPRILKLASGTILHLAPGEIPRQLSVSFATDPSRLFRIWDDEWESWCSSEVPLAIGGHPIPLKHWHTLYIDTQGWRALSNSYYQWKVRAERPFRDCTDGSCVFQLVAGRYLALGGEEKFWDHYSLEDGNRLKWTPLVNQIRAEKKIEDTQLVEDARRQLGNEFDSSFQYDKRGDSVVISRPWVIAEKWRGMREAGGWEQETGTC